MGWGQPQDLVIVILRGDETWLGRSGLCEALWGQVNYQPQSNTLVEFKNGLWEN